MAQSAHYHLGIVHSYGSTVIPQIYEDDQSAVAAKRKLEQQDGVLRTVRPCSGKCESLSGWIGIS